MIEATAERAARVVARHTGVHWRELLGAAWEGAHRASEKGDVSHPRYKAYVWTAARNSARKAAKDPHQDLPSGLMLNQPDPDEPPTPQDGLDAFLDFFALQATFHRAINSMSNDRDRRVARRYLTGVPIHDIMLQENMTLGAIKMVLSRVKKRMRD